MLNLELPTVLAIGPREVISLLFVIIAFMSWVFSIINGKQNGPGGARPNPRAGGGRRPQNDLQAEINRFLNNVKGKENEDELEVIEEEPVPRPKPRQKQRQKKPASVPQTSAAQRSLQRAELSESSAQGPRPGGRIAQRKGPGSTNLGAGLREHLAEQMQERVGKQADAYMAHGVAEKVEQDLGKFSVNEQRTSTAAVIKEVKPSITASAVAEIVRDPATMKQAFVMNLILTRPVMGRGKRSYSSRGTE